MLTADLLKIYINYISSPAPIIKACSRTSSKGVHRSQYLNWDITKDRRIIREIAWPKDASLVVLDELHKAVLVHPRMTRPAC